MGSNGSVRKKRKDDRQSNINNEPDLLDADCCEKYAQHELAFDGQKRLAHKPAPNFAAGSNSSENVFFYDLPTNTSREKVRQS